MGLISDLNNESHSSGSIETAADYNNSLLRAMLQPINSVSSKANEFISVLGLIVAFEKPTKSQGSDYMMRLRLMDPLLSPTDHPLALTVFRAQVGDMPDVRRPGDIIYFETAKVTVFRNRTQCMSNSRSRWDVLHADTEIGNAHPLITYLRRWWKDNEHALGGRPVGMGDAQSLGMPMACTSPSYSKPATSHGGSGKYFRNMSGLQGQAFADMYLEVVEVGESSDSMPVMQGIDDIFPSVQAERIQCRVTDYTANPLINTPDPSDVNGRFAWLTIFEPKSINKFPKIEPGNLYWFRNVRAEYSDTHGLSLKLSPNAMFPKTILVVCVDPADPQVLPLLARKAQYVNDMRQEKENAEPVQCSRHVEKAVDNSRLIEPEEEAQEGGGEEEESSQVDAYSMYGEGQLRLAGEPVFAEVTSIAEILESDKATAAANKKKIDYCVYRVKALVMQVHPPNPRDTLVFVCDMCGHTQEHMPAVPGMKCSECSEAGVLEFRLLLKLKDEGDGECVVVCQGIGDGEWARESDWLLADQADRDAFIEGIAPLWKAVHPAHGGRPGGMVAETLVASVVVPGPNGSVARSLLAAGGMKSISFSEVL
ncbi:hypothetical protein IW140_006225 [Coemansia sp. RSA 1813]|nr:hypothetical protein EV178_005665 [Coemansia sp. RSA 1646]KAJ1766216.1 hypothetical protein LPJ74_005990 [Coemansia sp. RSA 1843]KAJ2563111.1 hypothetical protein IW140_006225 [Coemansia sp. RSA 1813]